MVTAHKKYPTRARLVLVLVSSIISSLCFAIDNPDSPNLIAKFKTRAELHLQAINNPKNTNRGMVLAYNNYLIFLDTELNKAYQTLKANLAKNQQQQLLKSQKNWVNFRDAEYAFISSNWSRINFGSSANLSRGAYRSKIIEDRIIQLLNYAQNY